MPVLTSSAAINFDAIIKFKQSLFIKDEDDCWPWAGATNRSGYGLLSCEVGAKRTILLAHRISYFVFNGVDPIDQLVLHTCDNPPYCNPSHLLLGTQLDNQRDCVNRRRRAEHHGLNNGINSPRATLTIEEVLEIRQLSSRGYSNRAIAKMLGLTKSTVGYVCQRKTYKDIGD